MATITGNNGRNILHGRNQPDTINGLGGNDDLYGAGGADLLRGGAGNDKLFGGNGNDILLPGAGADTIKGGIGTDTVSYADAGAAVFVNLFDNVATGGAAGDHFVSVENIIGSRFNDSMAVGPGGRAFGGGGNDQLQVSVSASSGAGGILRGDAGNDQLDADFNDALPDRLWLQYDKGMDVIGSSFTSGPDKFWISAREFGLPASSAGHALAANRFEYSTDFRASNPSIRLVYETDTQILWADKDGAGSHFHSVPVADFSQQGAPLLGDFLVIA